jgi:hypothetical protein
MGDLEGCGASAPEVRLILSELLELLELLELVELLESLEALEPVSESGMARGFWASSAKRSFSDLASLWRPRDWMLLPRGAGEGEGEGEGWGEI